MELYLVPFKEGMALSKPLTHKYNTKLGSAIFNSSNNLTRSQS